MNTKQEWMNRFINCVVEVKQLGISVNTKIDGTVTVSNRFKSYVLTEDQADEFNEALEEIVEQHDLSAALVLLYLAYDYIGYMENRY